MAIGKQGLNVRLANRLCDWNIDVKTEEQFLQMDRSGDYRRAVSELFGEGGEEEILTIADLPGIDPAWAAILRDVGIEQIEDFLGMDREQLSSIEGLSPDAISTIQSIIQENVEVVEEEETESAPVVAGEETADGEEVYECPDCGARRHARYEPLPRLRCGAQFRV